MEGVTRLAVRHPVPVPPSMGAFWSAAADCGEDFSALELWEANWNHTIYGVLALTLCTPYPTAALARHYVRTRKNDRARMVYFIGALLLVASIVAMIYVISFCPTACSCSVADYSYSVLIYPSLFLIFFSCCVIYGLELGPNGQPRIAWHTPDSSARRFLNPQASPTLVHQASAVLLANDSAIPPAAPTTISTVTVTTTTECAS